jgi:hypothetical protein
MSTQKKLTGIDKTRRKLCIFSGILPFATSAQSKLLYSGANDKSANLTSFGNNYAEFYAAWITLFTQTPYEYIELRNREHVTVKSSEIVKQDFARGNTVELGGFILSKYEAAVIAHIGSYA